MKGVILVKRDVTTVERYSLSDAQPHCFRIRSEADEINFACESEEVREEWVSAVEGVIGAPTPEEVAAAAVASAQAEAEANIAAARAATEAAIAASTPTNTKAES